MELKVVGTNNLYNGTGRKMIVKEDKEGYSVEVKDGILSYLSRNAFNDESNDITMCYEIEDTKKIEELVSIFIENVTLNKMGISSLNKKVLLLSGANKKLYLHEGDSFLDGVYKVAMSKYLKDRSEYLNGTDVRMFNINLDKSFSSYGIESSAPFYVSRIDFEEECININLLHDKNNLLEFEERFISKFVYDKLCGVGEKAVISLDDELDYSLCITKKRDYCISCGDLLIMFENKKQLEFLIDVVDKYNRNVEKNIKRRVKKVGE